MMDAAAEILIGIGVIIGSVIASYGLQKKHIPKGLENSHHALIDLFDAHNLEKQQINGN